MADRKIIFDAVRTIRNGQSFTLSEVHILDGAIDSFLGLATPTPVSQIGIPAANFALVAARLGCTVAQLRAVDEVESGGGWYTDVRADILNLDGHGGFIDGPNLPKILFEAHVFDRETGGKYRASHPNLSSKSWNRALYVGGQGEWARLHKAMQLDRVAALRSASVGRYQIMGFNHKLAGYDGVEAYWEAMKKGEVEHLEAFATFIINTGMQDKLKKISNVHADCVPFARAYNGAGYAKNSYHIKIAKAHKKWSNT